MKEISVRAGGPDDVEKLAPLRHDLWPDSTVKDHAEELASLLRARTTGPYPLAALVAQDRTGRIVGFLEVGMRSYADGCDPFRPVGYVEGWYVVPDCRRMGVGALLMAAAEEWARGQGCVEIASDTWLDNLDSQRAHEALGFEEVDRCVTYRKRVAP